MKADIRPDSKLHCGACGAYLGISDGDSLALIDGYHQPDKARRRYAPTRAASKEYRTVQRRASRGLRKITLRENVPSGKITAIEAQRRQRGRLNVYIHDQFAFSVSEDLDSEFHLPLAIAAGFCYRWQATALHVTGEWFDGVAPFSALDVAGLPSEYPGISLTRRLLFEAKSVRNIGAGIEHTFPAGWQL